MGYLLSGGWRGLTIFCQTLRLIETIWEIRSRSRVAQTQARYAGTIRDAIHNPLFLGFHRPTRRRKLRSAAQVLAAERQRVREKSISQRDECFGRLIPREVLRPEHNGEFSRRR